MVNLITLQILSMKIYKCLTKPSIIGHIPPWALKGMYMYQLRAKTEKNVKFILLFMDVVNILILIIEVIS